MSKIYPKNQFILKPKLWLYLDVVLKYPDKNADKPICSVPPNNNKPNPFINFFKIPI